MSNSEPSSQKLVQVVEAGFSGATLTYILIIVFLLFISALMSASESAFFSLSPADNEDLKKNNDKRSKLVQDLLSKPKELLATMLITINFVNVGVVILSTFILDDLYPETPGSELKRFLLEVVGITLLILLTGEVVPKIFASKNALLVVHWVARPLDLLSKTPPISW
ncbi:MAG: DUF21 domain-containing protein, partial [Flavobacteriales bacterium]|nr:DUF21 domain-containing protein [Flavobacteriales bacterium]